jgi:hypothetical protein
MVQASVVLNLLLDIEQVTFLISWLPPAPTRSHSVTPKYRMDLSPRAHKHQLMTMRFSIMIRRYVPSVSAVYLISASRPQRGQYSRLKTRYHGLGFLESHSLKRAPHYSVGH